MDSAGAFAVRVMVSTLSRAGWIDAAAASAGLPHKASYDEVIAAIAGRAGR